MRIIDDFSLPSKTVSEAEKKDLESRLRRSNRILKAHHRIAKNAGFSGGRRAFYASVCRGSNPLPIPETDLGIILDSERMEQDFLEIYSRMIFNIASRWNRRLGESASRGDIIAAGVEAFLKAFCSFTEDKRFSTYLTHCVNRHILKLASSLGAIYVPSKVSRLKSKISRLMLEKGVSFDSAMEDMGLSEKTKKMVAKSIFEVRNLEGGDICEPAVKPKVSLEVPEISGFEFSGLDLLVFEEFLSSGGRPNLSALSRKTINPKTNKPYTKMSMSLAWKRVRDKISRRYGKVA